MERILNVPIEKYALPFNRIWKNLLMHFIIALAAAVFWMPAYQHDPSLFWSVLTMAFFHDVAQAFGHVTAYSKLNERYDWIEDTRRRIVYSVIVHLLTTYAIYFTLLPLLIYFLFDVRFKDVYATLTASWAIALIATVIGIVFSITGEFFGNWKKSLAAEEKLQAQMMSYKYESLRNQINPHFLLDSFISLKRLVLADKVLAAAFIQKMSELYRHVLDVKDKEFIPLQEELEYMGLYLDLLKLRFGDQLKIETDLAPEKDDLIIPLSLQSVIENAVENGVVSDGKLLIRISRAGEHIQVSSTFEKPGRDALRSSGLRNLEQQYQFYSRRPVEISETATSFSVRIPVLKQA